MVDDLYPEILVHATSCELDLIFYYVCILVRTTCMKIFDTKIIIKIIIEMKNSLPTGDGMKPVVTILA